MSDLSNIDVGSTAALPSANVGSLCPYRGNEDGSSILNRYIRKISQFETLDEKAESELALACQQGDLNAAHRLITSHLRLVVKIAFSYRYYGLPTMDLISEGNLGLAHAVKKFKPENGNRFSTYAMWWIRAAIQDFIIRSWSLVRIGTTIMQRKLFFSLNKIKRKLGLTRSDGLSDSDIKMIRDCTGAKASEVIDMDRRLSCRDASMGDAAYGGGCHDITTYEDILPCDEHSNTEDAAIYTLDGDTRRAALYQAMSQLSERERYIIHARMLCDDKAITLEQLSKKFSLSKERVRQIAERALQKLREDLSVRLQSGLNVIKP